MCCPTVVDPSRRDAIQSLIAIVESNGSSDAISAPTQGL
jgi:hypothetical protein